MAEAFIAIEDRRFRYHLGVDTRPGARAARNMSSGSCVQGGSTITQQLARNMFLTPNHLRAKFRRCFSPSGWSRNTPRNRSSTLYLNRVYFGAGAYGIDAAARRYFDKPASEADAREAAILAGL